MTAQINQSQQDFRERSSQLIGTQSFQTEMDILWSSIKIRLGRDHETKRSFIICSASKGEGSTTITMGLGRFVAKQTGKNVLLVDAIGKGNVLGDIIDSDLEPLIEEPEDPYNIAFDEFATNVPNLRYLRFKYPAQLETFFLDSREMSMFVNFITKRYDYIFVDAPPVLTSSVAPFLARELDNVIFVLASSTLRYPLLKEALSRLGDSSDRILGAVLNKREYPVPEYVYRFVR